MLEFTAIPNAVNWPAVCVCCTSQTGPFVDTHRDAPGYGHVYVCAMCAERAARVLGFFDPLEQARVDLGKALAAKEALEELLARQDEVLNAARERALGRRPVLVPGGAA